jgi:hypothetical protein
VKHYRSLGWGISLSLLAFSVARGEVKVAVGHNDNDHVSTTFTFKDVPAPVAANAAAKAKFSIVDGERDENGAELSALNDGKLPAEQDEPASNFFFNAGTDGGRLEADLGSVIDIKQVNTYSWHPNTRGPQVYKLYASDGSEKSFKADPKKGVDPATVGWKLLASVDTRSKDTEPGGQYAASIADSQGSLGKFRYLLFDVSQTESDDGFGNTFFSEINVIPVGAAAASTDAAPAGIQTLSVDDGKYQITIDTTETPDLTEWATKELAPVVKEWYPKIVAMLPSDGYEAPKKFSITFNKNMDGVAYTAGREIHGADKWFSKNLKGEAKGAIVHEMVHVVQQYRGRRGGTRPPGWLVEGIPDYIRWYKYEPQSHGADITARGLARARFDGSYRVSANFLNYVVTKYDKDLIRKINAQLRTGSYDSAIWKTLTGKTIDELNDEWKENLGKKPEVKPGT